MVTGWGRVGQHLAHRVLVQTNTLATSRMLIPATIAAGQTAAGQTRRHICTLYVR